jgi:hypothetical protein
MTPKLPKYFTIPWLDRIVVIMDTFRTPYLNHRFNNNITFPHSLEMDEKNSPINAESSMNRTFRGITID